MGVSKMAGKWKRQDVEQWVDAHMDGLIRDLMDLVNIRSVAELDQPEVLPYGKGCQEVLKTMLSMGEREGFSTQNYENYVGCISLNEEKEDIGIWAHLDVVDEGEGWQYPPYDACVKEGFVIGRGANDNKSSAAMGLYVLKFFRELDQMPPFNIRLYLGTCEEQGMYDLDYFTANYPCPSVSMVPDSGFPVCCGERGSFNGILRSKEELPEEILDLHTSEQLYLVPEKAEMAIRRTEEAVEASKRLPEAIGVAIKGEEIRLTARGITSSAASPEHGVNALQVLLDGVFEAGMLSKQGEKAFGLCRDILEDGHGAPLGVFCEDEASGPMILTATVANMRDRRLEVSFISKYPVTKNAVDFPGLAGEACRARGMELEVTRHEKANYFDPGHPLARVMTAAYNDYMGLCEEPFIMSGGTYARKLPRAFACGTGMPGAPLPDQVFLPGHGEYHQPDEAIAVERIRKALIIYILGILHYWESRETIS